jgi:hypothetical protein
MRSANMPNPINLGKILNGKDIAIDASDREDTATTDSEKSVSDISSPDSLSSLDSGSPSSANEAQKQSPIKEFIPAKGNGTSLYSASKNQAYLANKSPKDLQSEDSERNTKRWVAKSSPNALTAYCEVVVQEFYRLLAPELLQPKARLASNKNNGGKLGTATEYIETFEPLWENGTFLSPKAAKKIQAPREFGLTTFLSYFFNETDLKPDHVDKTGRRIDSDYGLSALIHYAFAAKSGITDENIQSLPYPISYNANQWLDQIVGGERHKTDSSLIFFGLSTNLQFKNSVNKGILRLLTLPKELIINFVAAYVPDVAICKIITNFILQRNAELFSAVQPNGSFKSYIATDQAKNELSDYIRYACNFQTTNKRNLVPEDQQGTLYESMKMRHQILRQAPTPKAGPSSSPVSKFSSSSSASSPASLAGNSHPLFNHNIKQKQSVKFKDKESNTSQQNHKPSNKFD